MRFPSKYRTRSGENSMRESSRISIIRQLSPYEFARAKRRTMEGERTSSNRSELSPLALPISPLFKFAFNFDLATDEILGGLIRDGRRRPNFDTEGSRTKGPARGRHGGHPITAGLDSVVAADVFRATNPDSHYEGDRYYGVFLTYCCLLGKRDKCARAIYVKLSAKSQFRLRLWEVETY